MEKYLPWQLSFVVELALRRYRTFFASNSLLLKSISSRSTKIMNTASTHWNLPIELWKKEGLIAISSIFNFTYFFKTNLYSVMMRDLFCPDLLTNKYKVWLLWLMIFVNSIWDFIPNKNINLQTWFVQLKLTSLESEKFRINLSIHKESLKTYLINPTTGYFGSSEWLKISNNWIFWLF